MSWMSTGRYGIRVAPDGLALVQELLNTRAIEPYGADLLGARQTGARWLRETTEAWAGEQGLSAPESAPSATDLARLTDLRAALASMLTSPHGTGSGAGTGTGTGTGTATGARAGRAPTPAIAPRRAAAELVAGPDGRVRIVPAGPPGEWLESAVWAQVLLAQAGGTWPRLKLCRREACGSAFYDLSRNNSGVWHDVRTCGNVMNLRASRLRRKQLAATSGDPGER